SASGAAGPFDELAVVEGGTGADEGNEVGCVDDAWAASMSLNAMARPAAVADLVEPAALRLHRHRGRRHIRSRSDVHPRLVRGARQVVTRDSTEFVQTASGTQLRHEIVAELHDHLDTILHPA